MYYYQTMVCSGRERKSTVSIQIYVSTSSRIAHVHIHVTAKKLNETSRRTGRSIVARDG